MSTNTDPRPSLAELRVWATKQMPVQCEFPQDCETCRRGRGVLALVELAEAYLAVRDLDALPASEIPTRPIGEYRHALDRLYAAAKQVRP